MRSSSSKNHCTSPFALIAMRGRLMEVKERFPRRGQISPGGIVDVADHAGAAAHVGDLRFGVALLIILLVEGRVHEAEKLGKRRLALVRMARRYRS